MKVNGDSTEQIAIFLSSLALDQSGYDPREAAHDCRVARARVERREEKEYGEQQVRGREEQSEEEGGTDRRGAANQVTVSDTYK